MAEEGVQIEGGEELKRFFSKMLPDEILKFVIDEFKPQADMVMKAMRAQAPVGRGQKSSRYRSRTHPPGTLRESIGKRFAGTNIPVVYVGPGRKNRGGNMDAWYDHIVIGGHEYGGTQVPADPFVRRTWDIMGGIVASNLKRAFEEKIRQLGGE